MRVVLCSMFRNSVGYLQRYVDQVESLRKHVDVQLIVAEGDSTDHTEDLLRTMVRVEDIVLKVDHGGGHYGSVDHPQRWANIAIVARAIANAARISLEDANALIWVESDMVWTAETMVKLLKDLGEVPAVSPLVLHPRDDRFYDIWGFRKDGRKFEPHRPFHPKVGNDVVKIDSCGSCFVARPSVFDSFLKWDGIWPFQAGGELWLDPRVFIRHP